MSWIHVILRILAQSVLRRTGISFFFAGVVLGLGSHPSSADSEELRQGSGIRTLKSQHLTLHTDLPLQKSVDELPQVFDLAVPEWAKFFNIAPERLETWHVVASIIKNRDRFQQYGLLPKDLPEFLNGFQRVDEIWIHEQPSDYYRRHLLLHEGTHSVMNRIFGQVGPVWYREGLAEHVATHQYHDGRLQLAYFPRDKKQVEHWGRIRIVKDEMAEGKIRSIRNIVDAPLRDYLTVESYAWTWALQAFGHTSPVYHSLFSGLQKDMHGTENQVTQSFLQQYQTRKTHIDTAWYLFLQQLDYGYDASHERIFHAKKIEPISPVGANLSIDVSKAWQSTGLRLPPRAILEVAARGRFKVASDREVWWCEPQGITIEYYQGRPLGILLGAIVDSSEDGARALARPFSIGHGGKFSTNQGGILYLRVNERADRLTDNEGTISVEMSLKSAGL